MDLENSNNVIKFKEYSNIDSLYYPSNVNSTLVNNLNRVTNVGNPQARYGKNNVKRKSSKIDSIFVNNSIRSVYTATSEEVINIREENEWYTGVSLNKSYHNATHSSSHQSYSQLKLLKQFEKYKPSSCFKNTFRSSYEKELNYKSCCQNRRTKQVSSTEIFIKPLLNGNMCSEKNGDAENSVNCQHVRNNEEFIRKVMERNIRLEKVLRSLMREYCREKPKKIWNNYINELKNKHRYYNEESLRALWQSTPDIIDDYDSYPSAYQQPDPLQSLLNELYRPQKYMRSNRFDCILHVDPNVEYYTNNRYCYPTSSQARVKMNREKARNNLKYFHGGTLTVNTKDNRVNNQNFHSMSSGYLKELFNDSTGNINTTTDVQTDINLQNFNYINTFKKDYSVDEIRRKVSRNIIDQLQRKISKETTDSGVKHFENIHRKLDTLIMTVDSVITDVRTLKRQKEEITRLINNTVPTSDKSCNISNIALNSSENNTSKEQKIKQDFITMVTQNTNTKLTCDTGTSMSQFREYTMSKMDQVIQEEMEKSKKIKKDIEELLYTRCDRQCSVQMAFDIPTKESKDCHENKSNCEVTDNFIRSEYISSSNTRMTIAVNTDPLSLLALLRVSTDTIKQLLSYVPDLNYRSYLSMLQLPRPCIQNYSCYMCGNEFSRPSQLSDHIRKHNFGNTRNCCVYRNVIAMESKQNCLFNCKYCSKRFSRAYCCELHQQTCAKLLGKKHNVLPSLMYLR